MSDPINITEEMLDAGTTHLQAYESDDTMDKETAVAAIYTAMRELEPTPGVRGPRDELPDIEERSRRMVALIQAPALPLGDVGLFLDVPLSTLDMLRAKGEGPHTFKIGRRLYVRQADLRAWLDQLAEAAR